MMRFPSLNFPLVTFALLVNSHLVSSQASGEDVMVLRSQAVRKGIDYLLERGQAEDGTFSGQAGSAVTGLVIAAILHNEPGMVTSPRVRKSLDFLVSQKRADGGVYAIESRHRNYESCVAIMALQAANREGQYTEALQGLERFLKKEQWDEGEGLESSDMKYGGAGYGSKSRPDLSNTSYFIEALRDLGRDESDESIKKALIFVSRTQNLYGPYNSSANADKVNDGGFYYTPSGEGESFAGKTVEGGLRSYGSMTYAGLKSMIFAGVTADDPRVKGAMEFIKSHYSLKENPGMGTAGLYYYYHTFAKAMRAVNQKTIVDIEGKEHDWRGEIVVELASRQKVDGSWVNGDNNRWMEGDTNLVTAYALLALAQCK
jgi:squalene-hopene/tetraprenyl-beta-curcumene cyclase